MDWFIDCQFVNLSICQCLNWKSCHLSIDFRWSTSSSGCKTTTPASASKMSRLLWTKSRPFSQEPTWLIGCWRIWMFPIKVQYAQRFRLFDSFYRSHRYDYRWNQSYYQLLIDNQYNVGIGQLKSSRGSSFSAFDGGPRLFFPRRGSHPDRQKRRHPLPISG